MFRPPSLLVPQVVPTAANVPQGSRNFYIRAERASLPPHAPDMLAVRIQVIDGARTFTLQDSQPCRLLPYHLLRKADISMHYESAPLLEQKAMGNAACGGFAPAPPGFSALMPLPIRGVCASRQRKGDAVASPGSVEATETALGLLPSMALSSAQFKTDSTAAGRELTFFPRRYSTC
jgi:hypothetical protein